MVQFSGIPNVDLVRDLTKQEAWVLRQWRLPIDRPILDRDLKDARLVRDPGHRKRLEAKGLPRGHWHGGRRFAYPIEIALFLLLLGNDPPPAMIERSAKGLARAKATEGSSVPPADTAVKASPPASSQPRRQRRVEAVDAA